MHPPRRASRAELERRLKIIRSNMPTLLRLFPERADFLNEFSSFANDVRERAEGVDALWIDEQIEEILLNDGVVDESVPGSKERDRQRDATRQVRLRECGDDEKSTGSGHARRRPNHLAP